MRGHGAPPDFLWPQCSIGGITRKPCAAPPARQPGNSPPMARADRRRRMSPAAGPTVGTDSCASCSMRCAACLQSEIPGRSASGLKVTVNRLWCYSGSLYFLDLALVRRWGRIGGTPRRISATDACRNSGNIVGNHGARQPCSSKATSQRNTHHRRPLASKAGFSGAITRNGISAPGPLRYGRCFKAASERVRMSGDSSDGQY